MLVSFWLFLLMDGLLVEWFGENCSEMSGGFGVFGFGGERGREMEREGKRGREGKRTERGRKGKGLEGRE